MASKQRPSKRTSVNNGAIHNTSDGEKVNKKISKRATRNSFPVLKSQGISHLSSGGGSRKNSTGSGDHIKSRGSSNSVTRKYDSDNAEDSMSKQPKSPSKPRTPSSFAKRGRGGSGTPKNTSRVAEIKNMIKVRTPVDVPEFPDAYHDDYMGSRKNSHGSPIFTTAKRFDGPHNHRS